MSDSLVANILVRGKTIYMAQWRLFYKIFIAHRKHTGVGVFSMFFYEEVLMRRNLLSRGIAITLSAVLALSSVDLRVFAEGELESKR